MKTFNWLFIIFCLYFTPIIAQETDTMAIKWQKLDSEPEFPGGSRAFTAFWQNNFKPKKMTTQGEGKVEFTINADGSLTNIIIVKSLNSDADEAAIKAVKKMPRWQPAVYQGKKVASNYSISYWQDKINPWTGQSESISLPEPDNIKPNGWAFGVWIGAVNRSNDYADYFKPTRFTIGLSVGYRINRFHFGFEYDVVAVSEFKKSFLSDGNIYSPNSNLVFGGLNLYFPLGYSIYNKNKWIITPYAAPTINTFDIKERGGDTFNDMSSFSYTLGLNADYVVNKGAAINRRTTKKTVYTSCIRTRFYVNPMNLTKTNSTSLKGTSIGFSIGFHGFMNKEK